MSLPSTFRQLVLRERPEAEVNSNTFELQTLPLSSLKVGKEEALVQVTHVSLDPAMRGWLADVRSYIEPVQIGAVMRAGGQGVVVKAGEGSKFKVGDRVGGMTGWAEFLVLPDSKLTLITCPPGATPLDFMNTLGAPGMTAYFGLHDVGKIKAGETLVVSGAAGAVGSLVCQLGKKAGATVIAIAGTPAKCEWLVKEAGVDEDKVLNYKDSKFKDNFRKTVGYLDVYFDNVGGEMLDLAMSRLKKNARIVLCGAISAYNATAIIGPKGIRNYQALIGQRARMEGFVVFDYAHRYAEAIQEIAKGVADGSIKRSFHIVEGLENAPKALPMLFLGQNTGKLIVKISDDPQPKAKM